jgi:hypothetical protein
MHVGCEVIPKEKKESLFRLTSSGTRASPSILLDIADDDPDDLPAVK